MSQSKFDRQNWIFAVCVAIFKCFKSKDWLDRKNDQNCATLESFKLLSRLILVECVIGVDSVKLTVELSMRDNSMKEPYECILTRAGGISASVILLFSSFNRLSPCFLGVFIAS